jgi:hypothetical protein
MSVVLRKEHRLRVENKTEYLGLKIIYKDG